MALSASDGWVSGRLTSCNPDMLVVTTLENPDKAKLWRKGISSHPSPPWVSAPAPCTFPQPPVPPFCWHLLTLPPAPCFLEQPHKQLVGFEQIPHMLHSRPIFLQPCLSDLFTLEKRRADTANKQLWGENQFVLWHLCLGNSKEEPRKRQGKKCSTSSFLHPFPAG